MIDYQKIFNEYIGVEDDLIPILQRIQSIDGYLSEESVHEIAEFLKISENQIFGVASFYSQFTFNPPGRNSIRICSGCACHVNGSKVVSDVVERELKIGPGETTADQRFDYKQVSCLGCCTLSPALMINEKVYTRMTVNQIKNLLEKHE
jgi:NADH-quinone oxidoreductase subunit E